ncbi:hypothetical protein HYY74_03245 [Candidatus Woesearchaeota archaeon]|nr:hypothetical protein [Candidatus Woesearchaeota archaeon]
MSVSIKISRENYERLSSLSGRLRSELNRPVSINEAISFLYRKGKLSDVAGTWKMTDREAEGFMADLQRGWERWKPKSA